MESAPCQPTSRVCRYAAPFGLESGRSNARYLCQCRRWRRSNCGFRGLFTVGATGTQMTPSGRRQAPVDFSSDVGLCVVAMRKTAFTIIGALLIAGSAVQMATASEHHMRADRGHHRWDRAYNQLKKPSYAAPQMRDGYSEGFSKPAANVTQSCDRLWCYAD